MSMSKRMYEEAMGLDSNIEIRENKIGQCEHCSADIIEIYEKDDTPGFRSSDTLTKYHCECRYYMHLSKKEIYDLKDDVHKYYKEQVIPKYEKEINKLKEILDTYKNGNALCEECGKEFDIKDIQYCEGCGMVMCPICYPDLDENEYCNLCENCIEMEESRYDF